MNNSLHALIVEDSKDDALLIVLELERGGFQVTWKRVETASDLKDALAHGPWDIALSDYSMPQFNAIAALEVLKATSPDLPCIVISGTIGEETAVAAMRAGAQDFFVKGRLNRLCAAVTRQLNESENVRQRRKIERDLRESEERRWREHEDALKREMEARQKIGILYREAEEANRLKEEFLHNLSHELRTPMNAITGWTELLANGQCDASDHPRIHSAIYRNALAQNKLIDDLLDLSRIVTGKLKIETHLVELDQVAMMAIETIEASARSKNVAIGLKSNSTTGRVWGDPKRLQEVIWNLLTNAVKFTPSGGEVEIEIRNVDSTIEISVSDNGEGIDPQFLPYIFDRFRQADASLTRPHGGLGLGLSIARHFVELHGGQIEARSEGLGKGTTMTVSLPIAQAPRRPTDRSKEANCPSFENALLNFNIMIVDDSEDSLELLNFILTRQGADVTSANSGTRACHLFAKARPDILICDIEMPGLNGYQVIRRIRKEEHDDRTKVLAVALTAHARSEDVEQAKAAGFDLHLAKPIDSKKLIAAILKLNCGRSPRREVH